VIWRSYLSVSHILTTCIAFRGHARAQSAQPLQIDGLVIGISPGFSCFINLRGHACAATQIPSPHSSGWHLGKSTRAILSGTFFSLVLRCVPALSAVSLKVKLGPGHAETLFGLYGTYQLVDEGISELNNLPAVTANKMLVL
jgi:hypothetical protein